MAEANQISPFLSGARDFDVNRMINSDRAFQMLQVELWYIGAFWSIWRTDRHTIQLTCSQCHIAIFRVQQHSLYEHLVEYISVRRQRGRGGTWGVDGRQVSKRTSVWRQNKSCFGCWVCDGLVSWRDSNQPWRRDWVADVCQQCTDCGFITTSNEAFVRCF